MAGSAVARHEAMYGKSVVEAGQLNPADPLVHDAVTRWLEDTADLPSAGDPDEYALLFDAAWRTAADLWVPKTCATWADASAGRRFRVRHVAGGSWPGRTCDDLGFAGLKLVFLIVTRAVSLLGLPRRESWWKNAEILMLRYQLAPGRA
ncbi:MAG TPA: hypothetical protein VMV92_22835 [Streptosporangiaceae bacterium]|nr:hypothetical protein [Streptosporangiaceae bacterium]